VIVDVIIPPSPFSERENTRRNRGVLVKQLGTGRAAIRAEKAFAMLIESGFAYCCIWARLFA
jgi:hypothetical protein